MEYPIGTKEADIEKKVASPGLPAYSSGEHHGEIQHPQYSFWTRMGCTWESFQRRPTLNEYNSLNTTLKSSLQMIAVGGSIGAGLFVGSGSALNRGGPGALLIDFMIIGVMLFNVVYALGELAVMYPVSGGFYTYATRFIDPSWGFAMGWNYVFQWAIVLPLELTVASLTVDYWEVDVSVAVWITVFLVAIIIINVFGVLGYGEEEFWTSVLKVSMIVVFVITGIVLICGGGPSEGDYSSYWGARTWYNPGAFANGFKGVCSVFVTAAFAFAGTELVGLAAAESSNPTRSLPRAVKQVFWRITLFYIVALLIVGMLVPHDDDRLLGANPYVDVQASPFVIALNRAHISGFPDVINVVILISVLSIGNSCVYGGSRTLTALAEQGYAPSIFTYVDRAGRPLISTVVIIAFGCLAYVNLDADGVEVFDWLLALSGLAALFTWGSICLSHIRFRRAWAYHGHSLDEIPFKAVFGVWGSWVGLLLNILVLIAQFYTAVWPLGGGVNDAEGFFKAYLAAPVVIAFWFGGYFWKHKGWQRTHQIDVDSGRRVIDWDEVNETKARVQHGSIPTKIFEFFC